MQIEVVIADCQRLNYLDDVKYCRLYTLQLRRKGYGAFRIEQMLKKKGLPDAEVDNCMRQYCDEIEQIEDCRKVLKKKISTGNYTDPTIAEKARLYRFLANRGFSSPTIRQVLMDTIGGDS